jgi:hypothetical protein
MGWRRRRRRSDMMVQVVRLGVQVGLAVKTKVKVNQGTRLGWGARLKMLTDGIDTIHKQ